MKEQSEKRKGEYIKNNTIVQWLPGYIDYREIRQVINAFKVLTIVYKKFVHSNNNVHVEIRSVPEDERVIVEELGNLMSTLFKMEIRKYDAFVQFKVFELHACWRFLEQCWANFRKTEIRSHDYSEKRRCLKSAMQICYRNIYYIKNFCSINEVIITYLLTKIDKYVVDFYSFRLYHTDTFKKRNSIENLESLTTESYLTLFGKSGNKNKLTELVVNRNKLTKGKTYFFLGLFLGFVIFQVFTLIVTLSLNVIELDFMQHDPQSLVFIFPMFRGIALFILYLWGLAWNVYGFTKFNINYRLILKLGNHYSTYGQIMKRAGFFTVLLLLMFMLYLTGKQFSIKTGMYLPVEYTPFIVYLVFFSYIFFPSEFVFNPKGRKYLYRILLNIITSPFIPMTFIIAWTTDQTVSFVGPLKDLAYTICYYTSDFSKAEIKQCLAYNTIEGVTVGYVVAIIPLLYRMIQCVKQAIESSQKRFWGHIQMWNFFKYTSSFLTASFSFIYKFNKDVFVVFVVCSIVSTCYAYYWDLKYDWGFLQGGSRNRLLRDSLSYKSPYIYYFAIFTNFVLRCSWTLSISSFITAEINSVLLVFVTSFLEMFRRCMWNFFRIEKEHLANCNAFRTTEDASDVLKNLSEKPSRRKLSSDTDIYERFDNNFQIHEHLFVKDTIKDDYQMVYSMVFSTSDSMVRRAKLSFERLRKESEDFIFQKNTSKIVRRLYKAIGQQKLILVKSSRSKIKVD